MNQKNALNQSLVALETAAQCPESLDESNRSTYRSQEILLAYQSVELPLNDNLLQNIEKTFDNWQKEYHWHG